MGYKTPRDIPISPARYSSQRLLNFNQHFVSEQYYLRSSINFTMYKIKPGALMAGTVKSSFKGTIERFVARDNAFSFMH